MKAPKLKVTWPEKQGEDICHRVYSGHLPASLGRPQVGVEGSLGSLCIAMWRSAMGSYYDAGAFGEFLMGREVLSTTRTRFHGSYGVMLT